MKRAGFRDRHVIQLPFAAKIHFRGLRRVQADPGQAILPAKLIPFLAPRNARQAGQHCAKGGSNVRAWMGPRHLGNGCATTRGR
jgi:hypothetical protein